MSLSTLILKTSVLIAQASDTVSEVADETGIDPAQSMTDDKPIWELVIEGGWVMIPLAVMSVLAVYIFVERFMAIQKAQKEEKSFMMQIKSFIQNGDLNSAKNLCSTTNHPIAHMIGKGIAKIGRPIADIQASIENQGKLEIGLLEKRLSILATIAGAAPMIGFLGTTLGMIRAFHEMTGMDRIELGAIAPGIMEAMVTTVGGLIVGIIAYMCYNYLVSKVGRVIHKMEGSSIEFLDLLDEPGK